MKHLEEGAVKRQVITWLFACASCFFAGIAFGSAMVRAPLW